MKLSTIFGLLACAARGIDAAPRPSSEIVERLNFPREEKKPEPSSTYRLSGGQPTLVPVIPPEIDTRSKESLKLQKNGQLFFSSRNAHDTAVSGVAARLSMNYNFPSLILDHALECYKKVACDGSLMSLTFHDKAYYQHVKEEWTKEHELVVITSDTGCASYTDNSHHTYFKATELTFKDDHLGLTLKGKHMSFNDIINDAHLEFGQIEHSRPGPVPESHNYQGPAPVPQRKTTTTKGSGSQPKTTSKVATSTTKKTTSTSKSTSTRKSTSTSKTTSTTKATSTNKTSSKTTSTSKRTSTSKTTTTTTSVAGTQCGTLPSSTISGLPAASCGAGFDQILDSALGYYNFDDDNFAETWASIAPGTDISDFADPADLASPPSKRDLARRKFSFHFTFVAAIKSVAKAVTSVVTSTIKAVVKTIAAIPAAIVSVAKAAVTLVKEIIEGDPSVTLSLPLNYFLGRLDNSPWGPAKLIHVFKKSPLDKPLSPEEQAKMDEEIKKEGPELLPDSLDGQNHIAIYCVACGFNGTFKATGHIGFSITGIHNATMDFVSDLDVTVGLGVDALALKTVELAKKQLWSSGLPGFSIPDIIALGPVLYVEAGLNYEMKAIGQMLASSTHSYRNAITHVDFINPFNGYSSGWKPTVSKSIDLHGELSAALVFELPIGLMFGLDVLNGKFKESVGSLVDTTSLELEAKVEFDLSASTTSGPNGTDISTGGSLNDGECYGVAWDLSLHNQLDFDVLTVKNYKIFEEELPIATGCIGIEPPPTGTATSSHKPISLPTVAACSVSGNRLVNGNFASGQLSPFYIYTDATDSRNSWSVQNGYFSTNQISLGDTPYSRVTFRQDIQLCEGQNYTFTMDYQFNNAPYDVYTYGTIYWPDGTAVGVFGTRSYDDPASIGQWETRTSDPWTAEYGSATFEMLTVAADYEATISSYRNMVINYASGGGSKKRSLGQPLGITNRPLLTERQDNGDGSDGSGDDVQLDKTIDGSNEADDNTVNYDNLDPVNPDGSVNKGPDDSDLDKFASDSVAQMEADADNNQDFADLADSMLPPSMGGSASASNVSLFPALPDGSGISMLNLPTTDGTAQLSAGSDGNLYLEAVDSSSPSGLFASAQGVVGGDFNGRLFHMYANELKQLNVSRLRLSDETHFPVGGQMVTLIGVSASGSKITVASDTLGSIYYLATCNLQGQGSKIFLVQDPDTGLKTLQSPVASWTVTGGVASECFLLGLKPSTLLASV